VKTTTTPILVWVKSSYSGAEGGNCVEVAAEPSKIHVRDSKVAAGPSVGFSGAAWAVFLDSTRP
jgi:hypothetical protein